MFSNDSHEKQNTMKITIYPHVKKVELNQYSMAFPTMYQNEELKLASAVRLLSFMSVMPKDSKRKKAQS